MVEGVQLGRVLVGIFFIPLLSSPSGFFFGGGNILAIPCASPRCHTLRIPYRESVCMSCGWVGLGWVGLSRLEKRDGPVN